MFRQSCVIMDNTKFQHMVLLFIEIELTNPLEIMHTERSI